MIFQGLPIKGINRKKIDIMIQTDIPITVQFGRKYKTAYGYFGYDKDNNKNSKEYFIFAEELEKERLPKTLNKMIKKLENQRFYKSR